MYSYLKIKNSAECGLSAVAFTTYQSDYQSSFLAGPSSTCKAWGHQTTSLEYYTSDTYSIQNDGNVFEMVTIGSVSAAGGVPLNGPIPCQGYCGTHYGMCGGGNAKYTVKAIYRVGKSTATDSSFPPEKAIGYTWQGVTTAQGQTSATPGYDACVAACIPGKPCCCPPECPVWNWASPKIEAEKPATGKIQYALGVVDVNCTMRDGIKYIPQNGPLYFLGFPTKTFTWFKLGVGQTPIITSTTKTGSTTSTVLFTASTTRKSPTAYFFGPDWGANYRTEFTKEEGPPFGVSYNSKLGSLAASKRVGNSTAPEFYRTPPYLWSGNPPGSNTEGTSNEKLARPELFSNMSQLNSSATTFSSAFRCENDNSTNMTTYCVNSSGYVAGGETYSTTTKVIVGVDVSTTICPTYEATITTRAALSAPRTFYVSGKRGSFGQNVYSFPDNVDYSGKKEGFVFGAEPAFLDVRFFSVCGAGVLNPYVHTHKESFSITTKNGSKTTTASLGSFWTSRGPVVATGPNNKTYTTISEFKFKPAYPAPPKSPIPITYGKVSVHGNTSSITVGAIEPIWRRNSESLAAEMLPKNQDGNNIVGGGSAMLGPLWPDGQKFANASFTISNNFGKNQTKQAISFVHAKWNYSKNEKVSGFKTLTRTTQFVLDYSATGKDQYSAIADPLAFVKDTTRIGLPFIARNAVFFDSPQSTIRYFNPSMSFSTSKLGKLEFDWNSYHLI